jgi:hypothetical protein
MVAGEIFSSCAAVPASMSSSLKRRRRGTRSGSAGRQEPAAGRSLDRPTEPQGLDHCVPVQRRPWLPGPHRFQYQRLPQRLAGVIAVPPRRRAQLIENLLLPGPVGPGHSGWR